jgi:hypothetical protein
MRLYEEFGLSVSDETIYSRPQEVGLLAYQRSAQGIQAECRGHGGIQKNSAERVAEARAAPAPGTPLEVWFQDEMRVAPMIIRQKPVQPNRARQIAAAAVPMHAFWRCLLGQRIHSHSPSSSPQCHRLTYDENQSDHLGNKPNW